MTFSDRPPAPASLSPQRHLDTLHATADRVWEMADASLERPVPVCSQWLLRDLVYHLGNVAAFVRACLEVRGPEPDFTDVPPPPDAELIRWARVQWGLTVDGLAAAAQDAPAWNWSVEPHLAPFWIRCLTHEVAVHAWDAAGAVDAEFQIPPQVAVDGVDEILAVHLPAGRSNGRTFPADGRVEVHSTDTSHRWLVQTGHDSVDVTRITQPDSTADRLEATGVQLYLGLWDRHTLPVCPGR